MAHCEVLMNNSDCVAPLSEANGTKVGRIKTTCYACGMPACTRCSSTAKPKELTGKSPTLRPWRGQRICNDCRSQHDLPMVGRDYEGV